MAHLSDAPVVAFTAGVGEPFELLARLAASRFERLNRIPTIVLDERSFRFDQLRSPHWVKAFLWELVAPTTEVVVWFDADMVPLAPLGPLPEHPFSAAIDLPATNGIQPFTHQGERMMSYFNSGLFIARRPSRSAFDALARDMALDTAPDRYEQSYFNIRVREQLGGFNELPIEWNWFHGFYDRMVGRPNAPVRMVHFIDRLGSERMQAIRACYGVLGVVFPDELRQDQ